MNFELYELKKKSKVVGVILNFLVPGLGCMYAHAYGTGVWLFFFTMLSFVFWIIFPPLALVWLVLQWWLGCHCVEKYNDKLYFAMQKQ